MPNSDVELVKGSHLRWDSPAEYHVRRIARFYANFFRFFLLKMKKEWSISPEKRRFCIEKCRFILQFEVRRAGVMNFVFQMMNFVFKMLNCCIIHSPPIIPLWCDELLQCRRRVQQHIDHAQLHTNLSGAGRRCVLQQVSKSDEFCIKNKELCIKNKELCIKNKEFCIKNDECCSWGYHRGRYHTDKPRRTRGFTHNPIVP